MDAHNKKRDFCVRRRRRRRVTDSRQLRDEWLSLEHMLRRLHEQRAVFLSLSRSPLTLRDRKSLLSVQIGAPFEEVTLSHAKLASFVATLRVVRIEKPLRPASCALTNYSDRQEMCWKIGWICYKFEMWKDYNDFYFCYQNIIIHVANSSF